MTLRHLALVALVGVLASGFVWPESAEAQCSMCRRAFDSPEGRQLVAAFRSGILFLLAAPFVAFGVVATLAVRGQRRVGRSASSSSEPI
ncbi:MAG: hypothetical protein ABGY72_24740 [bacterium]